MRFRTYCIVLQIELHTSVLQEVYGAEAIVRIHLFEDRVSLHGGVRKTSPLSRGRPTTKELAPAVVTLPLCVCRLIN